MVDKNRAREGQKPIFCIPIGAYSDGGTVEYIGLGYKVIDFNKMEEIVDNTMNYYTKVHIGSWFMTYDSAYKERNKGIVTMQITDIEFVRTYRVVSDLQKTDKEGLEQRQDKIYDIESNIENKLEIDNASKEEYEIMAQEIDNMIQKEFNTVVVNEQKSN